MAYKRVRFDAIRNFREKLNNKDNLPLTGIGITLSDGMMTDALADSCDWLWYDMEHNPMSPEALRCHMFIAHGHGIPAIVRVSGPNRAESFDPSNSSRKYTSLWGANIKHALDMGADGILVPQIRNETDVINIIKDCKYPIKGKINDNHRGFGVLIGTNYGRIPVVNYTKKANKQIFICVMIETKEAVENIEKICQVADLDGIFIGTMDLSGSLGVPYDAFDDIVDKATDKIIKCAKKYNKYIMFSTSNVNLAATVVKKGVDILKLGDDTTAAVKYENRLKKELKLKLQSKL